MVAAVLKNALVSYIDRISVYRSQKIWTYGNVYVRFGLRSASDIVLEIFGQAINYRKFHSFLTAGLMKYNSVNDIAMCVFLCTSVTAREHLACREQFINIMNHKYFER